MEEIITLEEIAAIDFLDEREIFECYSAVEWKKTSIDFDIHLGYQLLDKLIRGYLSMLRRNKHLQDGNNGYKRLWEAMTDQERDMIIARANNDR